MLTFRRFTLLFFIILLSLNIWNIFAGKSNGEFIHNNALLIYVILVILYFGISFSMAFLPCSNFHHRAVCHGNMREKSVAITFDDGPDAIKTPLILGVLKKYGVKATFFLIGNKLVGNEQLLKQIVDEGHVVGNHSFSHSKWFDFFSARKMRAELMETNRLIKQITGKSPLYFRPPFGVVNPMISNALKNMPWQVVCWDIRPLDTLNLDPSKTRQKILNQLKPGAIILLHDFTLFTEHHLGELISAITNEGYGIEPLDKLLKLPAYDS